MTSGNFASVPVPHLWVDRSKRQRRELVGVEELAESIKRAGLIHPPVVTREFEIIAGETRVEAIKLLGWTHIPIQYTDELSNEELKLIELEENLRRKDIPWQDQCKAIQEFHKLKSVEPDWTSVRTAEALGMSPNEVSEKLGVAVELEKGNERVNTAEKYSAARTIVTRDRARRTSSALDATTLSAVEEMAESESGEAEEVPPQSPLLNISFNDWVESYSGPSFNFLHCDFPYGAGMTNTGQGTAREVYGGYQDDPNVYWKLLAVLRTACDKVVADSAHLMFWFSMEHYSATKTLLEEMGWKVNAFPLMWMKSDNTGVISDANRQPRRVYETAFFAARGDRLISKPVANAFAHPGRDKTIHMSEKPRPMLKHFLSMFVDQYSRVLDPTAGSANALRVARDLGARSVLGLEKDEEFWQRAVEAWDVED